ncbi:MAG: sn-glycerol-1-phosphate dehydrogenase [Bacteroidales bacterium]|nr:sn-glycerol-1-phosphate dehydrogenase [Bacteroidales bacterium]
MNLIQAALKKTTDTKACIIGAGALREVPALFRSQFKGCTALVVADRNTWRAAGEEVARRLDAAGIPRLPSFIFDDPHLYAEWSYLEQLEAHLKEVDAIAVAVGSGVINDLAKLASSRLGRAYMVVGTAASMDGYTAFGASITYQGNKQTFACRAPRGLVIDPVIAAKAPEGMAASGYADLMAKVPAGADWIIAEAAGAEGIDPSGFELVQRTLRAALSKPDAVAARRVLATEKLCTGLVMSGFAMQACRSSRPASGMEHQFSHYWDMEGLCFNGTPVSHGFKVGIGTLVSTACLEYLLDTGLERIDAEEAAARWPSWEGQEKTIRTLFAEKPAHLERALSESLAKYTDADGVRNQLRRLQAAWPGLRERIRAQILPFSTVYGHLRRAGAPYEPEMIGVSREHLRDTFRHIPYMRSRYTSIDLVLRAGLLPEVEEHLFGPGGPWAIPA